MRQGPDPAGSAAVVPPEPSTDVRAVDAGQSAARATRRDTGGHAGGLADADRAGGCGCGRTGVAAGGCDRRCAGLLHRSLRMPWLRIRHLWIRWSRRWTSCLRIRAAAAVVAANPAARTQVTTAPRPVETSLAGSTTIDTSPVPRTPDRPGAVPGGTGRSGRSNSGTDTRQTQTHRTETCRIARGQPLTRGGGGIA